MTIDPMFAPPEEKRFGNVHNGKYHMPLLPGEQGTKAGGNWVPYGLTRMTNLVGANEDTRALSVWEQAMGLAGLAMNESLYEELVLIVQQAQRDGVDFRRLRDYPELKERLAGSSFGDTRSQESIIGRAKIVAGASHSAQAGTNRHEAWEHFGRTGELTGTKAMQEQVIDTARLLAEAGLQIVPDLIERCVRNVELGAAGRFDNVLLEVRTGRLLMADLKTKATAFYSWNTVDAQLAGYARSEWMLTQDGQSYEEGPVHYVDQTEGVVLHIPSDGSPAYLRRADLEHGWEVCLHAKKTMELRAYGKSAERRAMSEWIPGKNLAVAS